MRTMCTATFVIAACASAGIARSQWTLTSLHPPGLMESNGRGVSGGHQAGQAMVGGPHHAVLWSGTAASWVDLHPSTPGIFSSNAFAVGGSQQAGFATAIGSPDHAALWTGTAASWVDLNPAGSTQSTAYAVRGGQQAGFSRFGTPYHAGYWTGTASSFVDLNPTSDPLMASVAYGTSVTQQVGYTRLGGGLYNAALWSGTALSWVNLDPAGSIESWAWGVDGGQQVGYAVVGGVRRASLWTGSAASWVDLTPAGATSAWAFGVSDGYQAGFVTGSGGGTRASVWHSTASSWEDLQFYSPGYQETSASSVWTDGSVIYVVGEGINTRTSETEALMWTRSVPAPGALVVMALGAVAVGRRRRVNTADA